MLNNKKTIDVQFYQESGTIVDDLDTGRGKWKNLTDQEELEQEQRERENRIKQNNKIKKFCVSIQEVAQKSKFDIEFDIPYFDLSFNGTPNKSNVVITPTLKCLVNLAFKRVFPPPGIPIAAQNYVSTNFAKLFSLP